MNNHTLLLSIIILGVFILTLATNNPSITGYVPTKTFSQSLNITATESQRLMLSTPEMSLASISLTGKVEGKGLVNIYLNDGKQRRMIYTNKRKKGSSMQKITGFAANDIVIRPGEKLNDVETLPDKYTTVEGSFANACFETCVLDIRNPIMLGLDILLDDGTTLQISEIIFSTQ